MFMQESIFGMNQSEIHDGKCRKQT